MINGTFTWFFLVISALSVNYSSGKNCNQQLETVGVQSPVSSRLLQAKISFSVFIATVDWVRPFLLKFVIVHAHTVHACVCFCVLACVCVCVRDWSVCGETENMPVCLYTMCLCESLALSFGEKDLAVTRQTEREDWLVVFPFSTTCFPCVSIPHFVPFLTSIVPLLSLFITLFINKSLSVLFSERLLLFLTFYS